MNQKIIVIVDDEEISLMLLGKLLSRLGLMYKEFSDPLIALTYIRSHIGNISTVISDHMMPGMTGIELLSEIKVLNKAIYNILLTGTTQFSDLYNVPEGIDLVHVKPLAFGRLKDIVSSIGLF